MSKETINFQIVLFLRDKFKINFEQLSLAIKEKIGESENTQILPIPNDAPFEIPRLILNYKELFLNVSVDRISIVANTIASLRVIIPKLLALILEEKSCEVNRIGFVRTDFIESTIDKVQELIKKEVFSEKKIKEVSVRINSDLQIMEFNCNDIESLQFSKLIKTNNVGTVETEGIVAQRDLNTVAEVDYKIDSVQASKLITEFELRSNKYSLLGG